jgi:Ca2+-binding RTX toxin-like protein
VHVIIGEQQNGDQVAVFKHFANLTHTCEVRTLGDINGLNNNYIVRGSDQNDVIWMVKGAPQQVNCTNRPDLFIRPLNYNNHFLDISGLRGNDYLESGSGDTWAFGDQGDDWVEGFSPVGVTLGGPDHDNVIGNDSSTDQLLGEGGNDCLYDRSGLFSVMDCGPDSDRVAPLGPTTLPPGCERRVRACE